jgi:hypothetical protein
VKDGVVRPLSKASSTASVCGHSCGRSRDTGTAAAIDPPLWPRRKPRLVSYRLKDVPTASPAPVSLYSAKKACGPTAAPRPPWRSGAAHAGLGAASRQAAGCGLAADVRGAGVGAHGVRRALLCGLRADLGRSLVQTCGEAPGLAPSRASAILTGSGSR